jgi:PhnB protein
VEQQEASGERGVGEHRIREQYVGQRIGFGIVRQRGEVCELNDHQARLPRTLVDGASRVGMGGSQATSWPGRTRRHSRPRRERIGCSPTIPMTYSAAGLHGVMSGWPAMSGNRSSQGGRHIQTGSVAMRPRAGKNVQDLPCEATYVTGMSITAHIVVQGADRAAAFYRDAFGAEEIERIPTPDGRLMSVQLRIAHSLLHVADEFPEMGVLAPPSVGGTAVVLALDVADAAAVFAQAVAAGAEVRQPLQDTFWGDRHGQLDDPFGHRWNVDQHLRDVPHDEVVAAAARAFS